MNRVQIYSAISGLLILLTGVLYFKGYWNTWEDYRVEIAEQTNDCYANVVVTVGEALKCPPMNDPEAAIKKCTEHMDILSKVLLTAIISQCNEEFKDKFYNENSNNI